MLLSRKLNLRFSVDSDMGEAGSALEPLKILTDWPAADCQPHMETALFGHRRQMKLLEMTLDKDG